MEPDKIGCMIGCVLLEGHFFAGSTTLSEVPRAWGYGLYFLITFLYAQPKHI